MAFAAQQPGRGNEAICELSDENQRLRALIQQRNHEIVRLTSELHAQPSGLLEAAGSRARSQPRYWSAEEHERFLQVGPPVSTAVSLLPCCCAVDLLTLFLLLYQGLNRYGPKAFKSIATFVGTRTATQVNSRLEILSGRVFQSCCSCWSTHGLSAPASPLIVVFDVARRGFLVKNFNQVRTHAQKYFCKLQAKGQHATARSQVSPHLMRMGGGEHAEDRASAERAEFACSQGD